MSQHTLIELNTTDKRKLCFIANALSSPERIDIITYLYNQPSSVQAVADKLNMPFSSAATHIKKLEDAGIVVSQKKVLNGKAYKICIVQKYLVNIILRPSSLEVNSVISQQIPIGAYTDCYTTYPSGLISQDGFIGVEDEYKSFFNFDKINAQLIWLSSGYLEYKVPNILPKYTKCKKISISMEVCSEAPGYDENYISDIYLAINNIDCGCFQSLGDYGARRGILTPNFWASGLTQYGKIAIWEINEQGTYINNQKTNDSTVSQLSIENSQFIKFRIASDRSKPNCGGLNLFGSMAGDYQQDILMTLEY